MHYAMELSLVNYLAKNNQVICLICNNSLDTCEVNVYGDKEKCSECVSFQKSVLTRMHPSVIFDESQVFNPFIPHPNISYDISQLININKLINIKIENFDIGKAVLNHIIPNYGLDVDLADPKILRITRRLLYSLIETYFQLKSYINTQQINCGLIFNGRFPHEAAFLAACKEMSIEYIIHERASDPNKIGVYVNTSPHFLWETAKSAEEINLELLSEESISNANEFALAPYKKWQDQHFAKWQVKDSSPAINRKLITIFLSTQEEYVAIPGAAEEPTFYEKLHKLLLEEKLNPFFSDFTLVIRDHPHSLIFSQSEKYRNLFSAYDFIDYHPPESNVDSYALMNASEFIMTFGSTVGLEALSKGIKVVCMTNLYAAYAVNLPGVLVYDPFKQDIDKLKKFMHDVIPKEEIIATSLKISASILKYDVEIPGWSYKSSPEGTLLTF